MSLAKYQKKRDFTETTEPKATYKPSKSSKLIFVIQKHNASHLHYDFRLEVSGVLKSWAIPKGLSNKIGEKRLAVETEDHPIEYANFEGEIPKGQYGGGAVEIWDHGVYENITMKNNYVVPMAEAIKKGHINIMLEGKKAKGNFALIFFKEEKNNKQWLIFKQHEK